MVKTKKQETIRGERTVYERTLEEDICVGCCWRPMGGSCLLWKYRTPEACRAVKEDLKNWKPSGYHSQPEISVSIHRVLSQWDYKTRFKSYKYYRITSIVDMNGYRIVSTKPATEGEWLAFVKKEKEKEKQPPPSLEECPPPNHWI